MLQIKKIQLRWTAFLWKEIISENIVMVLPLEKYYAIKGIL